MKKLILDIGKIQTKFKAKELLTYPEFKAFIEDYFSYAKLERPNSTFFLNVSVDKFIQFLIDLVNNDEEVSKQVKEYSLLKRNDILNLIDSIFDYWRKIERYLVFVNTHRLRYQHREFVEKLREFSDSIADAYRDIYELVSCKEQTVYRELPSGSNAGVLLTQSKVSLPDSLKFLDEIPLMEMVETRPPFIIKTRQNKRVGFYFEQDKKVTSSDFDSKNAYGVLINICNKKALVYFDLDYMGFIVALGNLFKVETYTEDKKDQIDFVVLFGTTNTGDKCYYYKENGKYIGVLPKQANIDYFGYAKKMILTLFNLIMIEEKLLPIHGAGIQIRRDNKVKNFVILGDSGAGKSETIEAIKNLYKDQYQIETIFDDMGTFHLDNDGVNMTGTEIGAFVRLDDLDQGYSLRSADRAVFLNIDEVNSRVVIPIEDEMMAFCKHHVDCFLLADNFTDNKDGIVFYKDANQAIPDFLLGKRMAMSTTSETGIVTTFFANPFGPVQKEEEVRKFLPNYFERLFKDNIPVGKIYTRLSLDRKDGPKIGASKLIELFEKMD